MKSLLRAILWILNIALLLLLLPLFGLRRLLNAILPSPLPVYGVLGVARSIVPARNPSKND